MRPTKRTSSKRRPPKRPANVLQFKPQKRRERAFRPTSWLRNRWPYLALVAAPVLGIGVAWLWHIGPANMDGAAQGATEQYDVSFSRCHGPIRVTCVVDGDTLWLEGQKIRIADINTPEVSKPQCSAERALGERATSRLIALLNEGGFSLRSSGRDEDDFGRKLRIITRHGQSIGSTLVAEGLAERWTGSRRNWC